MKKPPRIPSRIRELARLPPGRVVVSEIECLRCGEEWTVATAGPTPLMRKCPFCGRTQGVRKDEDSAAAHLCAEPD